MAHKRLVELTYAIERNIMYERRSVLRTLFYVFAFFVLPYLATKLVKRIIFGFKR